LRHKAEEARGGGLVRATSRAEQPVSSTSTWWRAMPTGCRRCSIAWAARSPLARRLRETMRASPDRIASLRSDWPSTGETLDELTELVERDSVPHPGDEGTGTAY
jgi:hypothetical protein